MITQTFEIRVAILGYVSVGKTTVLNALLQDKFSEVSMRRTTAGIHFFRIVSSPPSPTTASSTTKKEDENEEEKDAITATTASTATTTTTATASNLGWSLITQDEPRLAPSTLQEISHDNQILRDQKNVLQEKTFEIPPLQEPLCDMRPDTALVLMDVPGLNEADSKNMYHDYVTKTWNTFDAVVVVMDAEKGVNTNEQVELLNLVQEQLQQSKRIPVIVLCNKVDDPDDEEIMTLVQEMQAKVEEIFRVSDRSQQLQNVLTAFHDKDRHSHDDDKDEDDAFPIFLPVSAGNAFAYRMAGNILHHHHHGGDSMDEFANKLDMKIIDKLGREEVGTFKWKQLSKADKIKTAFDAIRDTKQYQERLQATNFDKFLTVLAYCIGGDQVQREILAQQANVTLGNLAVLGEDGTTLAQQLQTVHDKFKVLQVDSKHLTRKFWTLYNDAATQAYLEKLQKTHTVSMIGTMDASAFTGLMKELIAYAKFVQQVGWFHEERDMIYDKMEELVRQQLAIIFEFERAWTIGDSVIGRYKCAYAWEGDNWIQTVNSTTHSAPKNQDLGNYPWHWERDGSGWRNVHTEQRFEGDMHPVTRQAGGCTWKTLTYHDWVTVLSSLLLVSHNRHFYERFGHEKMKLEGLLHRHSFYANGLATGKTASEENALYNIPVMTKGSYVNGTFVPTDPLKYKTVYQVENPRLISDPSHWGHLVWKFCTFMEQMEH